jgi:DNA-binding response OmpR family regulator
MEKPYRILLLEDEPLMRGMLAYFLSSQGWRVLTAGSLREGEMVVQAMGWDWPDLVLADANLSRDGDVLDGYLFHARWRARHPVPPFVFMRGQFPVVRLPGEDDCRVSHVSKPFRLEDLVLLIRAILA